VPVEGQWSRVNNPLPARDRRVLTISACVLVLVVVGAIVAYLAQPSQSNAGCIRVTIPSTMGGATQRHCGADAKRFCLEGSTLATAVEQCRALGYSVRRTVPSG
jgi:hypothetical protein